MKKKIQKIIYKKREIKRISLKIEQFQINKLQKDRLND